MSARQEPIAIVGIGCRFPGNAGGPEELWELLCAGFDGVVEVPPYRFDLAAVYDPRPAVPGKIQSRHGGFLGPVDAFDAAFFGISPREAARVDPQQRLLLEVGWEALEDAGLPPERLPRARTGVFVGMMSSDFEELTHQDPETLDLYGLNGAGRYGACGRLSFCLGLEGPSLCVDTACSSSLVAVHLACQSLRSGESEAALAGGCHLILQPHASIAISQGGILSVEGQCRFGDTRAAGFVRGEGAALVVLKPLRQARADGDRIRAVILGSAVNSDGCSNGVMATPSQVTQEEMLRQAYGSAGVSPARVRYVEAHGTGTTMGDLIELSALGAVLCAERPGDRPCQVGSIKTNIGHTEGASGIAGLIKLALCLEHRRIPRSLHCDELSPALPWGRLPLVLQRETAPWPADDPHPATGGVNSFGLSGTNAHAVLQEPPPPQAAPAAAAAGRAWLVPLSGRQPEALRALAGAWVELLAQDTAPELADLAHTAGSRRRHFEHRLAVVARSREELAAELRRWLDDGGEPAPAPAAPAAAMAERGRRIAFVFPGQGAQWPGMARELLAEPVFRAAIERCDQALRAEGDEGLVARLEAGADGDASHWLEEIHLVQPTLFAIQVALAALWRSWGVEPAGVVGHSMGELAAAHVAGALPLADAARVACRRSRLLRGVSGRGAMLALDLPLARAAAAVTGQEQRISVAASNGPASTVLSGDPAALAAIAERLAEQGTACRWVKVDVASHSPQVEPLLAPLAAALAGLAPRPGAMPLYSTVDGAACDGAGLDASYWARNLRQPVLFAAAVERMLADGFAAFVEIGPHPLLITSIEQIARASGTPTLAVHSLRRGEDRAAMLGSLGRLYTAGHPVSWQGLDGAGARVVCLPSYPWQRERHWPRQPPAPGAARRPPPGGHPLLGRHVELASPAGLHVWEGELSARAPAYLGDHRVHGASVLPAAAYLEMALAAAREARLGAARPHAPGAPAEAADGPEPVIVDIRFESALVLPEERARAVQVVLAAQPGGAAIEFFGSDAGAWTRHAAARVRAGDDAGAAAAPLPPAALRRRQWAEEMDGEAHYRALAARGLDYGPEFRGVDRLWRGDREALARLRPTPPAAGGSGPGHGHRLHPALLDACFQTLVAALPARWRQRSADTFLPVALRELRVWRLPAPGAVCWALAAVAPAATAGDAGDAGEAALDDATVEGDLTLLDDDGGALATARGLALRRFAADHGRGAEDWLYELRWDPAAPLTAAAAAPGLWLVLAVETPWTRRLVKLLAGDGSRCLVARPGSAWRAPRRGKVELAPEDPEGYGRLLELAAGQGLPLRGVVHLWSLACSPAGEPGPAELERARLLGCQSALHLVQALAATGLHTRLWLVTDRAQAPRGSEAGSPPQAPLLGLGRVIAAEHPEIGAVRVDVDTRETPEALARELHGGGEPELALRSGSRWAPRLVRSAVPGGGGGPVAFRADATYLLTGGLGGVGLAVARWMAERGARHLALVGRHAPAPAALAAIGAIEALGARVLPAAADVASPAAVAGLLRQLGAELPPLAGVLHLAGVLDDAPLRDLDGERLRRVMAPKVEGAWNLHAATLDMPLELFVLFSSAASVLGTHGQGSYAAANAFLDALARYRRARGRAALSVCWGAWSEVGLAAQDGRLDRLAERGIGSLPPAQACAVLGRLLLHPAAQVAVMAVDWPRWLRTDPAAQRSPLLGALSGAAFDAGASAGGAAAAAAAERDLRPALERAPPAERRSLLEARLRRETAEVLRLPQQRLDEAQALIRLGLDSLMALDLKLRIDAGLGVSVPVSRLLQGLSFRQLLAEILATIGEAADSKAAAPAPPSGGGRQAWEELEI
ncbi:MAG TPA: type I polyketide synthase [Thermoanaerobaculia bacterium]|nr:type I polyketide synthase [Thermoanaerobaculia bacterium]